jgi:DNA-directed RNA polymerase specialized sigma24 family protein
MVYDLLDTNCANDGEHSSTRESISTERSSPESFIPNPTCCEMSLPELAAQCRRELDNYRRGEPCTETYGVELLRRATFQDNQEAWAWMQHCFGKMVRGWLRHHPQREMACRLESEENYVAQTFERFWQATAFNQRVEFSTLAAALQYLRASLNGVILDMLRAYARPREVSLQEPGEPGELLVEDNVENSEDWEILHMLLSNPREQRVAYLLFHCGLKPREIVRFCPQEWSGVQEIYRLRRTIMERLLCHADQLALVTHSCDPD